MLRTGIALFAYLFTGPGDVSLEVESKLETAAPTCDPIETAAPGAARPPLTAEQRRETYRRVRAECARLGGSSDACQLAALVTARESSGRAGVRHRLSADRAVAVRSWVRQAYRYGWVVAGDGAGNLRARPSAGAEDPNPHYGDPERWSTGLGPHGIQPAIHLWRYDRAAAPEVLCSPEVSTRVLLGIWYRAIHNARAETWVEVNGIASGAIRENRWHARPEQDALFCARAERWGLDCYAPADLGRFTP